MLLLRQSLLRDELMRQDKVLHSSTLQYHFSLQMSDWTVSEKDKV